MPTLQQLYEESNSKRLETQIIIGGQGVVHRNPSWGFEGFGIVPTANFDLLRPFPSNIAEGDRVQIFAGFEGVLAQVFEGTIENMERNAVGLSVEASGASRPLKRTYRRTVVTLAGVTATAAIESHFAAVGIVNYFINLPAWTIGNNTPGEQEFETYGDAVNEIASVDGSPFWETPAGQVRVEVKDPVPSGSYFRQYFSGKLSNLTASDRQSLIAGTLSPLTIQPSGIANANAYPRLRSVAVRSLFAEVKNKIIARGAVVTTTGGDGSDSSERIEVTALGPSPFIPSPPQYQEFTLDVPLVDDETKLAETAIRYYGLKNRLVLAGEAVIDGDPEIFLGATVNIEDPDYTGLSGNWFVAGYRTAVTDNDFVTRLRIMGGQGIGNSPLVSPFACFTWAITGKQLQVLPDAIGPGGAGILITFDGGCSQDFDGEIASYSWSDTEGNTGTGRFFQAVYDPASVSTVDVTLEVTDADGLTDSVTKTLEVEGDDSASGGGNVSDLYMFVAAEEYMMGSSDGGQTWNDISRAAAGVSGDFVACASQFTRGVDADSPTIAIFLTDLGEIVMTTDVCVQSFIPLGLGGFSIGQLTSYLPGNSSWEVYAIPSTSASAWIIIGKTTGQGLVLFYQDATSGQIGVTNMPWAIVSLIGNMLNTPVNKALSYIPLPTWVDLSEYLRGLNS